MTHDADALENAIDHEDALSRAAAHEGDGGARTRLMWRGIALASVAAIGVLAALGICEMLGLRDGQAAPSVTLARTLPQEVAPTKVAASAPDAAFAQAAASAQAYAFAKAAAPEKLNEEPGASPKPSSPEEGRTANLELSAPALVSDAARGAEPAQHSSPGFTGETTAAATPVHRAKKSNFVVQVSAHRTEQQAREHFRALKARYPKLLSSRSPILARIGRKGVFWGTQLGPFASVESAKKLCNDLKSAGGHCIVKRTGVN